MKRKTFHDCSVTLTAILLAASMLSGCSKTTATEDNSDASKSQISADDAKSADTLDIIEPLKPEELADGKRYITVVNNRITCSDDEKEWASGCYPQIIFNDEYKEKYPRLSERIDELNAIWAKETPKNVAEYASWAKTDTYSEDPHYESEVKLQVVRADDRLFTLLLSFFDWSGGAHPNHYTASINIDPVTGSDLRLDQILDDSTCLSEAIRTNLEKNYEGIMEEVDSFYFQDEDDDPDQFVQKLKDDSYTYTLDDKGLCIMFSPYEIASYAAGYMEVTLTTQEYPQLIKKDYIMDKPAKMDKIVAEKEGPVTEVEPQADSNAETLSISNPTWDYYLSENAKAPGNKGLKLTKTDEKKSDWLELHAWAERNGFTEASPEYSDENYSYLPYNSLDSSFMYTGIIVSDADNNTVCDYDLNTLCNGPDDKDGKTSACTQFIRYAILTDDVLYVEMSHYGYASEEPDSAYIAAIDVSTGEVLFKTEPLTANAGNFRIVGDTIICGYGFTAEPDHIYLLDRYTGERYSEIPVNSAPAQFEVVGDELYVATYNTEYVFKIE